MSSSPRKHLDVTPGRRRTVATGRVPALRHAVPLVAIDCYEALREQVTEPLRELLMENRVPEDVFRGKLAVSAVPAKGR